MFRLTREHPMARLYLWNWPWSTPGGASTTAFRCCIVGLLDGRRAHFNLCVVAASVLVMMARLVLHLLLAATLYCIGVPQGEA